MKRRQKEIKGGEAELSRGGCADGRVRKMSGGKEG